MIDISRLSASSAFVGFENTDTPVSKTFTTPAVALAAGFGQRYDFTYPLDNSRSVSRVRINFETQNTDWYQLEGYFSFFTANIPLSGIDLAALVSYSSGNIVFSIYVVNTSGAPLVVPAQTYNVRYRLFNTPF